MPTQIKYYDLSHQIFLEINATCMHSVLLEFKIFLLLLWHCRIPLPLGYYRFCAKWQAHMLPLQFYGGRIHCFLMYYVALSVDLFRAIGLSFQQSKRGQFDIFYSNVMKFSPLDNIVTLNYLPNLVPSQIHFRDFSVSDSFSLWDCL